MKFWFSGEVDARVAESYREVRCEIEKTLNATLGANDYGPALEKLAFIPMLLGPEFLEGKRERRLIKHKEKASDYRLIIDFDAWQAGTVHERRALLMKNVLDSIQDIGGKLRGGFDAGRLHAD